MKTWTMTTLREKLIKIGAKVVRHAKYVTFQMAQVAVPRRLYRAILERIRRFASDADPTSANVMVTEASIPSQLPGVCNIGADNLGNECALRVFRQTSFARNGTFEHTIWTDADDFDLRHLGKALRRRNGGPAAESGEGYLGNAGWTRNPDRWAPSHAPIRSVHSCGLMVVRTRHACRSPILRPVRGVTRTIVASKALRHAAFLECGLVRVAEGTGGMLRRNSTSDPWRRIALKPETCR